MIMRMILVAAILATVTGLSACSSEPEAAPVPEATQLPAPEISPPQKQDIADTPVKPEPEEAPPPETAPEPETTTELEVGPQVGKLAPVFEFMDPGGDKVKLSDLRGSPVVLNFWATWCGPCKFEMPLLQALAHDEEKAAEGLVLLTINGGESADTVSKFMYEHGYSFTVLLDTQNGIARAYNVRAIPTSFFIDKDGVISNIKVGAFKTETELDTMLNGIMN